MNNYHDKNPEHLSLVGPKFCGKSVLLHAFYKMMKQEEFSSSYITVMWNLSRHTPVDNNDFLLQMCKKIGSALQPHNDELAQILLTSKGEPYEALKVVIEDLEEKGSKTLMIWDGFDKPLTSGKLTRNLWDNMRFLAENKSFRLITATRLKLTELISDDKSRTSDFWTIFSRTWIDVFDEDDKESIFAKVKSIQFDRGSKLELSNWTGGFPPLYLSVINELWDMSLKQVNNEDVNRAAKKILDSNTAPTDILKTLFESCSEKAKESFENLIEYKEILKKDISGDAKNDLTIRGLAKNVGNKIIPSCRLMEHYITDNHIEAGTMTRLFKESDDYQKNIKRLLEIRLNQIKNIDDSLMIGIKRAIKNIHEPNLCFYDIRFVAQRALDLALEKELPGQKDVPEEWISDWENEGSYFKKDKIGGGKFPTDNSMKLNLLQRIIGAYQTNNSPKAKYVKRPTYYHISNLNNFGNYGQHLNSEMPTAELAAAVVLCCLELAESLDIN
jgi:hypothetical protein